MNAGSRIVCLILAIGAFVVAGPINHALRDERRDRGLTQTDPLDNAPPLVAFTTVALGGFRGILADWLWMRASTLQEEGRYFELVQLSDWITKLEPRLSSVWAFHGWNLAYNISVLFDDPEDRWRWVRHGISLLRDEGLRYNPDDPKLLHELGWLFQHKLGMNLDNAHMHYKRAWAGEMSELFDGPAPDFEAYAAALKDPSNAPEETARRAKRMREVYRLDPATMGEVERLHGPLDWRLPQAHAIYWAFIGLRHAADFDAVRAQRMISQAVSDAFRQGRLFINAEEDFFALSPNLELIPRVQAEFEQALREHPDVTTFPTAHRYFLTEAMTALYSFNRIEESRAMYREIETRYPAEDTQRGFESFLYRAIAADMKELTDRDAQAYVEGLFSQAFFWEGLGDPARAGGFDRMARLCWTEYMRNKTDPEYRDRVGLPPIQTLRELALQKLKEQWPDRPGIQRLILRTEPTAAPVTGS